jgi:L-ribulose-5-phosphate 3-epimerase
MGGLISSTKAMNLIGIMQGRLSTPSNQAQQTFPAGFWREEFSEAAKLGFDTIEWLVEAESLAMNPLLSKSGREEIKQVSQQTGVRVVSVCAHCVLQWQPYDIGGNVRMEPFAEVIAAAGSAGVERVVIPLLEASTTHRAGSLAAAAAVFHPTVLAAEHAKVDLAFELDRSVDESREFIECLDSPRARLCYDSGNATADGRDIVVEIDGFLQLVAEIHLKDRRVGGSTMPLGQGDTLFTAFFKALADRQWRGPFMLETPVRDNPVEQARQNLAFIRKYWP